LKRRAPSPHKHADALICREVFGCGIFRLSWMWQTGDLARQEQPESSKMDYCVRIIERLREENALLRSSAMTFGALAERLTPR
jgi:hypothetical protein